MTPPERSRGRGRPATPVLSAESGARVFLKAESLQATGSFKLRGATYKLSELAGAGTSGVVPANAAR